MFHCGLGLGLCRLMLSIFDIASSIVCIGKYVSTPFPDVLGVREGVIESRHAFNVYIDDMRSHLESLHPRLCRLLGVKVAVVLYSDDAAIPADNAEHLHLAATMLEGFCNDNRLFISTSKSFVTVFHPVSLSMTKLARCLSTVSASKSVFMASASKPSAPSNTLASCWIRRAPLSPMLRQELQASTGPRNC